MPVQGKREDKRKAQEGRGDTTERRTVSSGRDATGMVACRWHDDDCVSLRHGAATAAKPAAPKNKPDPNAFFRNLEAPAFSNPMGD